jgi:hypothetical protein
MKKIIIKVDRASTRLYFIREVRTKQNSDCEWFQDFGKYKSSWLRFRKILVSMLYVNMTIFFFNYFEIISLLHYVLSSIYFMLVKLSFILSEQEICWITITYLSTSSFSGKQFTEQDLVSYLVCSLLIF